MLRTRLDSFHRSVAGYGVFGTVELAFAVVGLWAANVAHQPVILVLTGIFGVGAAQNYVKFVNKAIHGRQTSKA